MIGQIFNERYEILEKIGEGGMAITYRGHDRVLSRVVAIKVMRPELASDAEFLARFRREAQAAGGISHEHIAHVYDTGSDGAYHYIVMEYVNGESLKERIRRAGPLPLAEALRIVEETAKALDAAHSVGVVHRDIKPQNILLRADNSVKVTDFGIARATASSRQTETGTLVGSVHYVSPEQARGEQVGPQTDIYSLGVTLFEMLIGRPPFEGSERFAILHKHIYDQPPIPGQLRPGLPVEVNEVVTRCLEKELSQRFTSAKELLASLAACPREQIETTGGIRARRPRAAVGSARAWLGQPAALRANLRRIFWVSLGVTLTAGVAIALMLWTSGERPSRMIQVPDLVGMEETAARTFALGTGLEYRQVGRRSSNDIAAGRVLSQNPRSGQMVPRTTVIKVVISEGANQVSIPNVTQMSVAQAERNLNAAGMVKGSVQEAYDERVPARYVCSTLPATGTLVVRGTAVDLVVSKGPRPELPPLPSAPGRQEKLTYTVPDNLGGGGEVTVTVEVSDEEGERIIYEEQLKPGDSIPPQTISVTSSTTVRVLVNGQVQLERQYEP